MPPCRVEKNPCLRAHAGSIVLIVFLVFFGQKKLRKIHVFVPTPRVRDLFLVFSGRLACVAAGQIRNYGDLSYLLEGSYEEGMQELITRAEPWDLSRGKPFEARMRHSCSYWASQTGQLVLIW
jgi:hypothetical protein